MKITFRQSGGYAGLIKGCELDTDELPANEATAIKGWVKSSGILVLKSAHSKAARDVFNYSIAIETSEGAHHVEVDDTTVPESLRPLLNYLRKRAEPRPLS